MNRVGMRCGFAALVFLLCVGGVQAQGIEVRKQTKEIPLPAQAKPAAPAELTAAQLFGKASPSVVVLRAMDKKGNTLVTGSGVVFAHGEGGSFRVATNCHVVDVPDRDGLIRIYHGEDYGTSGVIARDAKRDLCLLTGMLFRRDAAGELVRPDDISAGIVVPLPAPPVAQIAPLRSLEIGERVYAIGAPQGLELSLSEGLVSGLRKDDDTTLIQTTAAISKGSSGGGLFDAQGRLVGITTMYLKDSQALNFAVPAELIAGVPRARAPAAQSAARAPEPASAPPPPRDRWLKVVVSDSFTTYVDTQTLQRNGTDVTVWIKRVYDGPENLTDGTTYNEGWALMTYHCISRQTTLKDLSYRLRGNLVWSREYKSYEQERVSVMPDTVGESIMEAVCAL